MAAAKKQLVIITLSSGIDGWKLHAKLDFRPAIGPGKAYRNAAVYAALMALKGITKIVTKKGWKKS